MSITQISCFILVLLFGGRATAQDWKSRIQSSESREEIREYYKKFATFGEIHESEIKTKNTEYFVISVKGTKVRQVFLWAYRRDGSKWILAEDYAGRPNEELIWNISNERFERVSIGESNPNSKESEK